jgi:hypothetical protein
VTEQEYNGCAGFLRYTHLAPPHAHTPHTHTTHTHTHHTHSQYGLTSQL